MSAPREEVRLQGGSSLVVVLLALVLGVGAAFGVTAALVAVGSSATQVTRPLVNYNSP